MEGTIPRNMRLVRSSAFSDVTERPLARLPRPREGPVALAVASFLIALSAVMTGCLEGTSGEWQHIADRRLRCCYMRSMEAGSGLV